MKLNNNKNFKLEEQDINELIDRKINSKIDELGYKIENNLLEKQKQDNIINLDQFISQKNLPFQSSRKGLQWIKKNLGPKSLTKIGPGYIVEREEIEELFQLYLQRKKKLLS